jgi:SAM-dependent methyltransferase
MQTITDPLLTSIERYYSEKLHEFGASPQGVDWNSEDGQNLRFLQLLKAVNPAVPFSINDLGCGYGSLLDFLSKHFENYTYAGVDISEKMIAAAQQRHKKSRIATFLVSDRPIETADYSVASGIFNVRLANSKLEWHNHMERSLNILDSSSRLGFSFNCLTSYSDADKMRDYLHYASPGELFDLCKRKYSKNVALLHDYDLYEFTIIVRK